MTLRPTIAVLLALALAACAGPTPYQPSWMGDGYGYAEQRIEENRFRVSFAGNGATDPETVRNYLLHRAAELTLAQGGDHFVVTARSASPAYGAAGRDTSVSTGVGVGGGGGISSGWSIGMGLPLGAGGGGPYEATAEIVVRRGPKPEGDAEAYDARAVRARLGPRIRRPQP